MALRTFIHGYITSPPSPFISYKHRKYLLGRGNARYTKNMSRALIKNWFTKVAVFSEWATHGTGTAIKTRLIRWTAKANRVVDEYATMLLRVADKAAGDATMRCWKYRYIRSPMPILERYRWPRLLSIGNLVNNSTRYTSTAQNPRVTHTETVDVDYYQRSGVG